MTVSRSKILAAITVIVLAVGGTFFSFVLWQNLIFSKGRECVSKGGQYYYFTDGCFKMQRIDLELNK